MYINTQIKGDILKRYKWLLIRTYSVWVVWTVKQRYKEKVTMDQFLSGTNKCYVNTSDEIKKIRKKFKYKQLHQ